jgi:hypothetical protein
LERGTVFIETFAEDSQEVVATITTLPMSVWWDLDVFPVISPTEAGTAAGEAS